MHVVFRALILVHLTSFASACRLEAEQASTPQNFFENSRRRAAAFGEDAHIGKMDGCTSFFVKNTQGKTYVATARHCVEYSATSWCRDGGKIFDNGAGISRQCTGIVAGDGNHDIFLFEADGPAHDGGYSLAGFLPAVKTRIKMLGYPGDRYATRNLMATENCWVQESALASPHVGTVYGDRGLLDQSFKHNCSTYGGNSGGPMIVENADVVIGLPFTYGPDAFGNRRFTESSWGAAMADFVAVSRQRLAQAGVAVVDFTPGSSGPARYFRATTYTPSGGLCNFQVIPLYLTSDLLTQIKVRYDGCGGIEGDYVTYECPRNESSCNYRNSFLKDIGPGGFTYVGPTGLETRFAPAS